MLAARTSSHNCSGHTSYNSSPNYFPANVSVECVDDIEKQRYYQQNARMHRCCCGLIHSVGGTKLFLFFYTTIMAAGLAFGMASTFVWTGIPIVIVAMSIYALIREKHKYLYPFLIISGVHVLVCLLMALIIIAFTAANYPTLRQVIGHSISNPPTDAFIVAVVSASVGGFLLLAVMHVWQITVIYSCMAYYENKHNAIYHSFMAATAPVRSSRPPYETLANNRILRDFVKSNEKSDIPQKRISLEET
ncbi:hypothetical protein Tcan_02870 [Toxocara canis]|uniref:Uncharacterized protein n=1 Tax=Toxocara canis TaxID=6265 RepID=A0A0B2VAB1_TOXCA|nr:hypothetical protein Tcan_02870 [Toxocara canis]